MYRKYRKKNIIVDLDNTLTLEEWRREYIQSHAWQRYFDLCREDDINESVQCTIMALRELNYDIHILTSRSESVREETECWLKYFHIEYVNLVMRPAHHYQDTELGATYNGSHSNVKLEMAEKLRLTPENTLMVLEDTDEMVIAWREAGYDCWQVRDQGEHYHADN